MTEVVRPPPAWPVLARAENRFGWMSGYPPIVAFCQTLVNVSAVSGGAGVLAWKVTLLMYGGVNPVAVGRAPAERLGQTSGDRPSPSRRGFRNPVLVAMAVGAEEMIESDEERARIAAGAARPLA